MTANSVFGKESYTQQETAKCSSHKRLGQYSMGSISSQESKQGYKILAVQINVWDNVAWVHFPHKKTNKAT